MHTFYLVLLSVVVAAAILFMASMTRNAGSVSEPKRKPGVVKAGSNWKRLQRTFSAGPSSKRRRRSSGTEGSSRHVSDAGTDRLTNGAADADRNESSPAPTTLPWFADDLSPEDLALVRSNSGRTEAAIASTSHDRAAHTAHNTEGAQLRKRVILGGDAATLSKEKTEPGTYVAIDCEMVGVGPNGTESALARVTIVNWHGAVLMDTFVRSKERVTDYRTWVSGVRASDLKDAPTFEVVQARVAALIKDRILVGHAIHNDLRALLLSHPKHMVRDTASYAGSRQRANTKYPSLRKLVELQLGIEIQVKGESHSSVEDAQATMALYRTLHAEWQQTLQGSHQGALRKARKGGGKANTSTSSSPQIIGPGWKKNKRVGEETNGAASTSRSGTTKKQRASDDPEWWKKV